MSKTGYGLGYGVEISRCHVVVLYGQGSSLLPVNSYWVDFTQTEQHLAKQAPLNHLSCHDTMISYTTGTFMVGRAKGVSPAPPFQLIPSNKSDACWKHPSRAS